MQIPNQTNLRELACPVADRRVLKSMTQCVLLSIGLKARIGESLLHCQPRVRSASEIRCQLAANHRKDCLRCLL